jgi:HD-GYP domain-containing protein (c-di-GMP phosphodiesterase class II)
VACVAIQLGDEGVDLALVLERRPSTRGRADALMNVIGSVMRAATLAERLRATESATDGLRAGFEGLVSMSRSFATQESFGDLATEVFTALRRDLAVTRAAFYTRRDASQGLLDLRAATGFDPSNLDRLGLSSFHGIGKAAFASVAVARLASMSGDAVPQEFRKLFDSGLHWVVPILAGSERYGLLFFGGGPESEGRLGDKASHALGAISVACGLAFENLDRVSRLRESRVGAWRSLVAALELRRPEDRGHSDRVAGHVVRVGRAIGLTPRALDELELAARLHDVGKIDSKGDEAAERRSHSIRGSQILSKSALSDDVLKGVEQHHERWDGAGFPYGLRTEGIHVNARIIAVANAYDHWRNDTSGALNREEALHRLQLGAGLTLDPGIVAVFSSDIDRNPDRRGADDYGKVSPTAAPPAAPTAFMDVREPA